MSPFRAPARKYFIHAAHRAVGVSSATAALMACDRARSAPAEPSRQQLRVALFAVWGDRTTASLPALLSRYLRQRLGARCVWPGDGPIAADVAVLLGGAGAFDGRLAEHLDTHCAEGGAAAALGITPAQQKPDRRFQWDVFGVELSERPGDSIAWLELDPDGAEHPIIRGMTEGDSPIFATGELGQSPSHSWAVPCASVLRLADDAEVLVLARRAERSEPVAWVRRHALGRVFCMTLGPGEVACSEPYLRLAAAAVAWTAGREMPPD
jgi:hypothetical protein